MRVGIQILNYNGMRWLPGVIESLERHGAADQRLYVVDNGSSDESVAYLERAHPRVVVVALDANLGYGAAYNRSIPRAFADGCDWVCLQNSDTLVTPGWLDALARAADDPTIGIMGPVFWQWEADEPNYYMRGRCRDVIPIMLDRNRAPVDRDWIEGSSFFIRRECVEASGGFDPLYFMYWEDAEYCRRARLFGWRVVMVPGSVCRHFAGGSARGAGRSVDLFRSHFRYLLSDPSHSCLRNWLRSVGLAFSYVKQTAWATPNLVELKRVVAAVWSALADAGRCFAARSRVLARLDDMRGVRSPTSPLEPLRVRS
jgi:GT2 family glycosyltransferase